MKISNVAFTRSTGGGAIADDAERTGIAEEVPAEAGNRKPADAAGVRLATEVEQRASLTNWGPRTLTVTEWECLFEAARRAPSSWNHQPARYIAVTERPDIAKLCRALHRTNGWAAKAAALVVQAAAPEDDDRINGKDYYLYDCGLSMMSMVFQAQALGITTRQMIGWDETEVKALLGIPDRYRVVVIAAMGFPSSSRIGEAAANIKRTLTGQHKRFKRTHTVFWQAWGKGERNL